MKRLPIRLSHEITKCPFSTARRFGVALIGGIVANAPMTAEASNATEEPSLKLTNRNCDFNRSWFGSLAQLLRKRDGAVIVRVCQDEDTTSPETTRAVWK